MKLEIWAIHNYYIIGIFSQNSIPCGCLNPKYWITGHRGVDIAWKKRYF
jgi:hypothetical protein